MNFLAHAYLSFGNEAVLTGNMISDFVKGKKRFDYPPQIQLGISLHRSIDQFTDRHPATAAAKEFFRDAYGLYSAPIVDVVFDHFLATDPECFSHEELLAFSGGVYETLIRYAKWLPEGFARIFPYMKEQDWLCHYRERQGIARSLRGLARRAKYMLESQTAFRLFEEHYQPLSACFRQCWRELEPFAREELARLSLQ